MINKTVGIGLALLIVCGTATHAQGVWLGGVVGVNVATQSVESNDGLDINSRIGFNLGARLNAQFSPKFGVIAAALYSQKGFSISEGSATGGLNLSYIDVPLLVQFILPTSETGKVSVHFAAGPAVGLRLTCKIVGEQDGASVSIDCADVGADVKSVDLGVMGLVGVDIQAGAGSVILDLAYNLGLTDINSTSGGGSIKNRTLSIMAGYQFPLGSS